MILGGKKIWIEKNYNKNSYKQIIMDFWMIQFGPYFLKSLILVIFYWIYIVFPLTCMSKNCLDG